MGLSGWLRWVIVLSGSIFLSACTTLPTVPDDSGRVWLRDKTYFYPSLKEHAQQQAWRYQAKVGVRTPKASETANLVWQREADAHRVRLYGPLGAGAVVIEFDANGVVISDSKGQVHQGRSAERLLNHIVGWPIPLEALTYWLFALPNPDTAYQYQLNDLGQVTAIQQQGWEISYAAYQEFESGAKLPKKLVARKAVRDGEVVVRLVSKSWQ